jgi:hypothetical protein
LGYDRNLQNSIMSSIAFATGNQQTVNAGSANGADIVITKPTSLAVGDFMLACFSTGQSGSTPANMDLLSGWTLIKQTATSKSALDVMYKIAASGDVAASNFTFHNTTNGGTFTWAMAGVIMRWTGVDTTTPVVASNNATGSGTGITVTTITPGTEPMLVLVTGGCNGSATRTVSGQAIANNNPSWTEDYDFGPGAGALCSLGVAHAGWGFATATGSATATFNASEDGSGGILVALQPQKVYATIAASVATLIVPTTVIKIAAVIASIVSTMSVPAINITGAVWSTLAKHSSTWTNTTKN